MIEMTISLGHLIQLGVMLLALSGAYWSLKSDLKLQQQAHDDLERRLEAHEEQDSVIFMEIKDKMSVGFNRIYDKLDGKEDKG